MKKILFIIFFIISLIIFAYKISSKQIFSVNKFFSQSSTLSNQISKLQKIDPYIPENTLTSSSNFISSNNNNNNLNSNYDLQKVSITIKENTLTPSSATIIITDLNENPASFGKWFRIEKKENDNWIELAPISSFNFTEMAYFVDSNGNLEMKTDWSKMYGELLPGTYRLVKEEYDINNILSVEFTISY